MSSHGAIDSDRRTISLRGPRQGGTSNELRRNRGSMAPQRPLGLVSFMREAETPVEILRGLTAERNLEVMRGLRETAWALTAAGVRARHPDWSPDEIQDEVRAAFIRVRS